jgi:hypothetical protein
VCDSIVVGTKSGKQLLLPMVFCAKIVSMYRRGLSQLSVFALLFFGFVFLQEMPAVNGQNAPAAATTSAPTSSTADAHPVLVELFTSEGCSSCPPADALLQKMDSSSIEGGQLIVLSEHVDYWNHDGWKDPNSSSALTQRQAAYVLELGLPTAYTPQFIVDGTSEVRANDASGADKVFRAAVAAPKVPVHINDVTFDSGNPSILHARINADGTSDKHNADVFVAVALDHVESQVLHGENGGRHLTHVAVVTQLVKVGKLPKGKTFDESIQVKLNPGADPKNIRIVAFVQESGPGKLLGAALRKPAN